MSPLLIGLLGFVAFFTLLVIGMPVGIALIAIGFTGTVFILSWGAGMTSITFTPFVVTSGYDLSCIPLFLLMAHIVYNAGLGKDIYNLAAKWLGHQPGGLAMATVGGCAGFAAMCASSLATTVTFVLVSVPEMRRHNYKDELAIGCICAGGTIGILIPPSTTLILYGVLTETSIGKLFMGGLIPGILEAVFYIITIFIICRIDPSLGPKGPSSSIKEKFAAFGPCIEIILLVILVLGGIVVGWFTATEAGGVGVIGAILFSLLRKKLNWATFKVSLIEAMKTSGMLYLILIGGFIFMPFVTLSGIPAEISLFVTSLDLPPMAIMGAIMLVYIILGCFLESMSMILITIPIFFPLLEPLGFSAIWFGIIIVRVVEIGLITPPMGMNVFTVAKMTGTPVTTAFKGVVPFILADICHVAMLLVFPSVVLFLPSIL